MSRIGQFSLLTCIAPHLLAAEQLALPDTSNLEVAFGVAPPSDRSLWQPMAPSGVELTVPEGSETFWLRAKTADDTVWVVYGPLHEHETMLVQPRGNSQPFILGVHGVEGDKARKSLIPRVTVKTHRWRLGPLVTDVPSIPVPKVTIGGSDRPSAPATTPMRAGLEPDPIRNPADPQEAYCLAPMRVYNHESFPVSVSWSERHVSKGSPSCTGTDEVNRKEILGGNTYFRVFCSRYVSASSICSITYSASKVRADRN